MQKVLILALLAFSCGVTTIEEPLDSGSENHRSSLYSAPLTLSEQISMPDKIILILGQSNVLGQGGNVSQLSAEWSHLADSYAAVPLAYDITWPIGEPPTATYSRTWGDTEPHTTGYGDFGPEASMARTLGASSHNFRIYKSCHGATNLHGDWSPTRSPDWLYQYSVDAVIARAAEVSGGAGVAGVVWVQGTNDALGTEAQSLAYQTNLTALIAALRAEFGADLPFVFNKLHTSNTATYKNNVRAGQVATEAALDNILLVDTDDLTLADAYHYDDDGFAEMGQRLGLAMLDLVGDPVAQASDYLENLFINAALRGVNITASLTHTISLHSEPVGEGDIGAEVTGTGYAQQAVTFATPANRTTLNDLDVSFTASAADWDEAVAIAIRDSSGTLLYYSTIAPKTVANGETWTIEAGRIRVTNNYPSTYIANALLSAAIGGVNFTAPTVLAAALHTASVGLVGSGAEVPDADGYARTSVAFDAPSDGVTQNTAEIQFSAVGGDLPAAVSFAIWDSLTIGAGNLLFYADIDSVTVIDGYTFTIAAGGVVVAVR